MILAGVINTLWGVAGVVGGAGAIAVMLWMSARGQPEREREDAARDYMDEHGHWPDEDPAAPGPPVRLPPSPSDAPDP